MITPDYAKSARIDEAGAGASARLEKQEETVRLHV